LVLLKFKNLIKCGINNYLNIIYFDLARKTSRIRRLKDGNVSSIGKIHGAAIPLSNGAIRIVSAGKIKTGANAPVGNMSPIRDTGAGAAVRRWTLVSNDA
jgi:hypothetical protein